MLSQKVILKLGKEVILKLIPKNLEDFWRIAWLIFEQSWKHKNFHLSSLDDSSCDKD